ncbi:MAG TPA: hemerythrin domain-containing protein [Gemmatimonadales bacterium]|nr:hemerythrin domain-containing protein [Gemmatimonadales bacterium]
MKAPQSLRHEHDALHAALARAECAPGRVGEAARTLARIMHPHFLREDEYATPPLGLLPDLARGHVTAAMRAVLPQVERLRTELPLMLEEHRAIIGALDELAAAADAAGQSEIVDFAEELKRHAEVEEEIMYPAAILVGQYVKLRLGV